MSCVILDKLLNLSELQVAFIYNLTIGLPKPVGAYDNYPYFSWDKLGNHHRTKSWSILSTLKAAAKTPTDKEQVANWTKSMSSH